MLASPVPSRPQSRRFPGECAKACPTWTGEPALLRCQHRSSSQSSATVGNQGHEGRAVTEPNKPGPLRDAPCKAVLALGGTFATRHVDDELVRDIARALGSVLDRHIQRTAGTSRSMDPKHREPRLQLHPALAAPAPAVRAVADHEWRRLPGVFRRWEFEQVIDVDEEFLVEEAGHDEQGLALFAIYSRPHICGEGAR